MGPRDTETAYGYILETGSPFDEVRALTIEALAREGFGVLTEIDLQETLKHKVGQDVHRYVILGACRPDLAYRGIRAERSIGIMLPCSVAVWEEPGNGGTVGIQRPDLILRLSNQPNALEKMAREADERLRRVLDTVRDGTRPRAAHDEPPTLH